MRRLFLDRHVEFWTAELQRTWSLGEIRARVVDLWDETSDTRTFALLPNARWQRHRAGQYTAVEVEIDGVRQRRCYSISSAPHDSCLTITVKRVRGGRVSNWLHDHLRRGHVLRLGPAGGDFVVPAPLPAQLLLLSGGSGITPAMAILRDLAVRGAIDDVVFVHYARSRADVIFRGALEALAAGHRGLRLLVCLDDDGSGGFDESRLARLVPDFATRATWLCGPPGLMDRVERMWQDAGSTDRLRRERFAAPTPGAPPPSAAGSDILRLQLGRSGRSVAAIGSATLLEALERAGERPAFGCRMGICRTCTTRKRSGTVRNLVTGAESSQPDEEIQLCISAACSDVELGL